MDKPKEDISSQNVCLGITRGAEPLRKVVKKASISNIVNLCGTSAAKAMVQVSGCSNY